MSEEYKWTEVYRIKELDWIVGNDSAIRKLKGFIQQGFITDLLLFGPSGTGKTLSAEALCNELGVTTGSINCSLDTGIDNVRVGITNFARSKSFNMRHRILIMEEVDNMSPQAQKGMKKVMEDYSNTCSFILLSNEPDSINDALWSRCTPIEFSPLKDEEVEKVIKRILLKEGVYQLVPRETMKALLETAWGDARQAINVAQFITSDGEVATPDDVYRSSRKASKRLVLKTIDQALKLHISEAIDTLEVIYQNGATARSFIETILRNPSDAIYELGLDEIRTESYGRAIKGLRPDYSFKKNDALAFLTNLSYGVRESAVKEDGL